VVQTYTDSNVAASPYCGSGTTTVPVAVVATIGSGSIALAAVAVS
jgi:hypothetical protein